MKLRNAFGRNAMRQHLWILLFTLLLVPVCVASEATLTYENGQVVRLKDIKIHLYESETSAIPASPTACKSPSLQNFDVNAEGFSLHCGGRLYRIPVSSVAAFGNLRPSAAINGRSMYARFIIEGASGFDQIDGEPVFRTRIKGVKRVLGSEIPVDILFPDSYGKWISMSKIDGETWKVEGDTGSYTLYRTKFETQSKSLPKQLGPRDRTVISVFRGKTPNESFPAEYNVPLGNIRTIQFTARQNSDLGNYIEVLVTTAEDTSLVALQFNAISGKTDDGDTIWTRFTTQNSDGYPVVVVKRLDLVWD